MVETVQTWNTEAYATHGRFVAVLATDVVTMLNPQPGERILDAGCGDGALTEQLVRSGANVTGVDASPTMVAAARARGLHVDQAGITALPYTAEFDAVFSNAALHWIPVDQQPRALSSIHHALKPGGRFVAEMGGQGNIAAIRAALQAILLPHNLYAEHLAASFFPSPEHYKLLLQQAGFEVQSIALHARPTPLPGGREGMTLWLNTFRNGVLDQVPTEHRKNVLDQTVNVLAPMLCDPLTESWTADYVRLRFHATAR